jgi:hypothetical protein
MNNAWGKYILGQFAEKASCGLVVKSSKQLHPFLHQPCVHAPPLKYLALKVRYSFITAISLKHW